VLSELRCQNVQTLAVEITLTDKLLNFKGEAKVGPNNDKGQHEKQSKKIKDKGRMKESKCNEDGVKQP
jgi:hypothetical protein